MGGWRLRRAGPGDFAGLRAAHAGAFPVDYSDSFFAQAAAGHGRLSSWVVVAPAPNGGSPPGEEGVVGFVVCARLGHAECGVHDRGELLGLDLAHTLSDSRELVYILTLGVAPLWRRRGLARALLAEVVGYARSLHRCRAVYLHCIRFNDAALAFYRARGFVLVQEIPGYYHLAPDRAPDPAVLTHSALTLAMYMHGGAPPRTLLELVRGGWLALAALGRSQVVVGGGDEGSTATRVDGAAGGRDGAPGAWLRRIFDRAPR